MHRSTAHIVRWEASFVLVLLLAHFSFLVHLAICPHVISATTGEVSHPSHCDSPSQSDGPKKQPAKPDSRSSDDECLVFFVLTQASVAPVLISWAMTAAPVCEQVSITALDEPPPQQDLYRLSPSQSPPPLA